MAFPSSPTNGQKHTESGVTYIYVSSYGVWDIFDPNQDIVASDVLAKIKTVDGAGSGLDSDTVDGLHASQLSVSNADQLDGIDSTGFIRNGIFDSPSYRFCFNRNDSPVTGMSWYDDSYTAWSEYMSPAGQTNCGPNGTVTAPSGSIVTSWAQRSFIEHHGGYGWTFEGGSATSTAPVVKFEIRSSDGSAYSQGNITAVGDIVANSDERLKSEIKDVQNALDIVQSLSGKRYIKDGKQSVGLIAQEVEKVLPELIHTADDEMKTKSLAYGNMVAVLVNAIKEQQEQIEELKEKLNGV